MTHPRADVSRRSLLRGLFLGLGAAGIPPWLRASAIAHAQQSGELAMPIGPLGVKSYGTLVGKAVVDNLDVDHDFYAPSGFAVRVVMRAGVNPLTGGTSGTLGHELPDGGAVFPAPDGGWVYASNSEATPGGVSALRFDAGGTLVDYYRICTGTYRNCAGGPTPWGTWITCEEIPDGYAWECDPFGSPATQRRLDALGPRAWREAVAIDPVHHACYQTLDTGDGRLLRFTSNDSDLELAPNGATRMRMVRGTTHRLRIPPFQGLPGYDDIAVPNTPLESARLRQPRPIEWVMDSDPLGTCFSGAEGIWYHELPPELRTIPSLGSVPTQGVIFFSTKADNRVWAIDIENQLIELICDAHGAQVLTNLLNTGGAASHFNHVDNLVVSPLGDALFAEDGAAMRLAIAGNGRAPKPFVQITRADSELCGPAFTPDGSRLYFSSQRGPSGPDGTERAGVIYELTIPPRFRTLQAPAPFDFGSRAMVAPSTWVESDIITLTGFSDPMPVECGALMQYRVAGGVWTSATGMLAPGQTVQVRHLSSPRRSTVRTTKLIVGGVAGAFRSYTAGRVASPRRFSKR